ncbi:metal ABC transporter solute-binding protein, Zn/Mn family [Arthrobacter sp. JSM 101049]|uniref:metal ABC transporter solute-binding protein, Zn/Mn family n=1 Tax=Arthrobacter sp. JSM 101049 TaxID=929097 RepID=UPI00356651C9
MRSRLAIIPVLLLGLGLASCGDNAPAGETGEADALTVVASTNAYGDIVKQVAGDAVTVESIINRASQDPHSYEATPQDKLTLSHADLVVANGGGYDPFIGTLTQDLGTEPSSIITAVDLSPTIHADEAPHDDETHGASPATEGHSGHDHASFNEHVWYDLPTAAAVATEVADRLGELKPDEAATFTANAGAFTAGIDGLEARLQHLAQNGQGQEFAMTEPVPFYLLTSAGLADGTPEGFSGAIEAGRDVSPLLLKELDEKLSSGKISLLAYNAQTSGPQTEAVREDAEAAGVPVVEFTETLPEGTDYLAWMGSNIDAIAQALQD